SWYDKNRGAFNSINDALVKWVSLEQDFQSTNNQTLEKLKAKYLSEAQQTARENLWFNGIAGDPSDEQVNAALIPLIEADPENKKLTASKFIPPMMQPLGSQLVQSAGQYLETGTAPADSWSMTQDDQALLD